MTRVKDEWRPVVHDDLELHVPMLAGWLLGQVRTALSGEDWHGLRTSQFRLLSQVPRGGLSVTELAQPLAMTKQACGQLVTELERQGYLTTEAGADDRRVRVVRRSPSGDRVVHALTLRFRRLERQWARAVGPERFAVFRAVLEELALGVDGGTVG